MQIKIKHKDTEIVIDDNSDETTIKYSTNELIKLLEKISQELQAIENNYDKTTYEDE
jgi:predicted mannosyl-3-phosphoglycerate phosphatase (HAD superfamily)